MTCYHRRGHSVSLALLFLTSIVLSVHAVDYRIEIGDGVWEIKPGLTTQAWSYGGTVPGTPIVARPGERVRIEVVNRLSAPTNIHWHGLVLPNDQDGPFLSIEPGSVFTYDFVAGESGTYWYHPHLMPVLPQLDMGLYAPFIILAPEDGKYSGDHIYILDDWLLDANGRRLEGVARGDMERYGNVETVNGKTEKAIPPLVVRSGEMHKLRFINASTAAVHTIKISGHAFRITHTDGHPLGQPFMTDQIVLAPGERFDAELFASGAEGDRFEMASSRRERGIVIPVIYGEGSVAPVASPFNPASSRAYMATAPAKFDIKMELSSAMGMMGMGSGMMRWTIDGRSYPDTKRIDVKTGKVVTMRIYNRDMMSMMMGHRMDHPVHIHGTKFQVLSIDGIPPAGETWKDTIPVPDGGYIDIAFVMSNPGDWLLHCHIIDHEDGGMMTIIRAQ